MRVVQPAQRSQWGGTPGAAANRGYGIAQQRPVTGAGRLPVATAGASRGNAMSPTRMRMGGANTKYVTPPVNRMRASQMPSPQRRVESRQVPISPPHVPRKQNNDVIDLTDIDERDIDRVLPPKKTAPLIGAPKNYRPLMNRPVISPPSGYQFQVPPTTKQQKPHVPKVMPEQGRKPRVMSHHSEIQRLPVASASKNAPESPRSPMLPVSAANPGAPRSQPRPGTTQQRLADAHASRAAKHSRCAPQEIPKKQTKQAASSNKHSMSIADRLRAVNDSRPGAEEKASEDGNDAKDTIDGPLPQIPKQPKKEVQPSFDSAYNSAYSGAYSAYTSCTEYSQYTQPSMDSDISPFDTENVTKKRDPRVEKELIQHTSGKFAAESHDEFDATACLLATKELTVLVANDVKDIANFASGTLTGETQGSDTASTDSPEQKPETKTASNDKSSTEIVKKKTEPSNVCIAETQDCMMSFQEDVTFVAGLGISKIQEACLPDIREEISSIHDDENKNKSGESDESGCVNETADCMQSFREDVTYVANLGASKISGKKSTSTVEGASGAKQSKSPSKDDDSGLFAATADCFVQLKDDIKFGVTQMRGMKLSELEVRGLIVSIAQGLDEPLYLAEGDTGSVLTDDFRSSTASVNDLDSLDDSRDGSARSTADSAPSIDAMSADPVPSESILDSIKKQLELQTLQSFGDPVIEEIKRADPPGEEEETADYAIAASKSSNGRADPPAYNNPFEEQPSIAPGDATDSEESIEETDELVTVEETIEEETIEEETVEEEVLEVIEEEDERGAADSPNDEVTNEDRSNATLETEMETDEDTTEADKSESTTREEVLKTLEKTEDAYFPDLLPDEV